MRERSTMTRKDEEENVWRKISSVVVSVFAPRASSSRLISLLKSAPNLTSDLYCN